MAATLLTAVLVVAMFVDWAVVARYRSALRQRRTAVGSRGRRLSPGAQALLVLAYRNTGETCTALTGGSGVGTTTVYRDVGEGVDVLADVAPTLDEALELARRKAFVILGRTVLPTDRAGMAPGYDRAFSSEKHKRHGMNVHVLADPAGRLVWASPALPGARHDIGAAREHGLRDGLNAAGVHLVADTAYQGGGTAIRVPQRRHRINPRHRPFPSPAAPPERRQHHPCPPARPGKTSQRPTQTLESAAEDPQLPPPHD